MRIGTRGSELARTQTNWVKSLLEARLGRTFEVCIISTQGDRVTDRPLRELEGRGYFTKELEEALLDGRIDLAVHSFKDMPSSAPDGLAVAAVSKREDPADLLIMRKDQCVLSADDLFIRECATVGTSAVRREAQLKALRPDLATKDLRGNVPTRLSKLRNGEFDAILLASAGVKRLRLDLSEFSVERLSPKQFVPAPGQGALAIQMRENDAEFQAVHGTVHDEETFVATQIERGVQARFGGGCGLPLGAHAWKTDGLWYAEGFWLSESNGPIRASVKGEQWKELSGRLFAELSEVNSCTC